MPDLHTNINTHETINSGQVFLWENYENTWFVIDGDDIIMTKQTPFEVRTFSKMTKKFFREDDNYEKILKKHYKRQNCKKGNKAIPRTTCYKTRSFSMLHFVHCLIKFKHTKYQNATPKIM